MSIDDTVIVACISHVDHPFLAKEITWIMVIHYMAVQASRSALSVVRVVVAGMNRSRLCELSIFPNL